MLRAPSTICGASSVYSFLFLLSDFCSFMKSTPGSCSTAAVDGHSSHVVSVGANPAMTWKDRQRTRVPSFDLDDNPFCLERRANEERHKMQLNKSPSRLKLTSADVRRTASFMVDDQKPFREFSRKKQQLLAWSLRDASTFGKIGQSAQRRAEKTIRRSKTVPSSVGKIDVDVFFATPESGLRRRSRIDVDVDTLPNLEPYRREVAALQPITFGHRPVSASRMFNPSTMMTSFGSSSSSSSGGGGGCSASHTFVRNGGGPKGTSTGVTKKPTCKARHFTLKRARRDVRQVPGRVPGLSAPMLKELLLGQPRPRGGETGRGSIPAAGFADGATHRGPLLGPRGHREGGEQGSERCARGPGGVVLSEEDELSDASASNVSEWRSVDATGRGRRSPDAGAWLKGSSLAGLPNGKGVVGESSLEEAELRRIFSDARPQWDGTPAPLPAPKDVRRAISSLLQPDPDERLRDKIVKSRKAAAGIPVTSWSIMEEREKMLLPRTPATRWEAPPATPRAVIACEEVKKLVESRLEKDGAMARRIRDAELSAFYDKIPPSDKLYRDTLALAKGAKSQGVA